MMEKLSSYIIIYIVGLALVLFFMVILPGKRKNKKVQEMHNSVKPGDEVSTIGGIIGIVVTRDETTVTILIDEKTNTTMKVVVQAIQAILTSAQKKIE